MAPLGAMILIYLAWKIQIVLLVAKEVKILVEYSDFADVFFKKSAAKLLKYFNINNNLINLKPNKRLFYKLIYSLKLVEWNFEDLYQD